MLLAILVGHVLALSAQVLLKGWVDHQFFCEGVSGQFPRELVLPSRRIFVILGIDNVIVVLLQLYVIRLDGIGNGGEAGRSG